MVVSLPPATGRVLVFQFSSEQADKVMFHLGKLSTGVLAEKLCDFGIDRPIAIRAAIVSMQSSREKEEETGELNEIIYINTLVLNAFTYSLQLIANIAYDNRVRVRIYNMS